jgi:hypothetical protein
MRPISTGSVQQTNQRLHTHLIDGYVGHRMPSFMQWPKSAVSLVSGGVVASNIASHILVVK